MTGQVRDAAMIDTVFGYCAKNDLDPQSLDKLTFGEVVKKLAALCKEDPKWVWASSEVRRWYPICHSECHIVRLQAFMANDCEWSATTGPNQPKDIPDNVVALRPSDAPLH